MCCNAFPHSKENTSDPVEYGMGGGWVHPKGADRMVVSGLSFRNALVGSEWATVILLSMNGLRKQSSHHALCPFWRGSLFPNLASGYRLSAITIASLLMGGYGLSHEREEDGCKSTCVEFGG